MYRIVVNTCLDYQRRGRRMMPCLGELIEAVSAHSETVLHRLMRAEVEDDVQRIVARLSPEQRMVVVLRYTEGLVLRRDCADSGMFGGDGGVAAESRA